MLVHPLINFIDPCLGIGVRGPKRMGARRKTIKTPENIPGLTLKILIELQDGYLTPAFRCRRKLLDFLFDIGLTSTLVNGKYTLSSRPAFTLWQ